jgi:hypothetical protein
MTYRSARTGALLGAMFISCGGFMSAHAVTYHVATNGSDAASGSGALPWRTIQKAANTMVAGDVVLISPGDYSEYVVTKAHGRSGSPITFRADPPNEPTNQVVLRQFRVMHEYTTIEGFTFAHTMDTLAYDYNGAMVRIEVNQGAGRNGSHCVVTNNTFRDGVYLISDDIHLDASNNSVTTSKRNFATAGFVAGGRIFLGACSSEPYVNHDTAQVINSISADGRTLYLAGPMQPMPAGHSNVWAAIYAGRNHDAYNGIHMVLGTGAEAPTNCTVANNAFTNLFGACLRMKGSGHLVQGNRFMDMHGWYGILPHGSDHIIRGNTFVDSPHFIFFTQEEMSSIPHPPGSDFYDYQIGLVHTYGSNGGNVLFEENWFENCHNQMGLIAQDTSSGGFIFRRNVFVGMQAHLSVSRSWVSFENNTFYRAPFESGIAIAAGGMSGWIMTNLVVCSNAFVDVGVSSPVNAGWYTVVDATNSVTDWNFVTGAEIKGWPAKTIFREPHGINGGDPVFRDAGNPRGPDGMAFTADDGLRPLPNSPLAIRRLGALAPAVVADGMPFAHFTIASPLGWFEPTGTTWTNLRPYERTDVIRPYTTPATLGKAPVTAVFSAAMSISGVTPDSTNTVGIASYSWTFGDGGVPSVSTSTSSVSHTYAFPGDFTVMLKVANTLGREAVCRRTYRVIPSANGGSSPMPPPNLRVID